MREEGVDRLAVAENSSSFVLIAKKESVLRFCATTPASMAPKYGKAFSWLKRMILLT